MEPTGHNSSQKQQQSMNQFTSQFGLSAPNPFVSTFPGMSQSLSAAAGVNPFLAAAQLNPFGGGFFPHSATTSQHQLSFGTTGHGFGGAASDITAEYWRQQQSNIILNEANKMALAMQASGQHQQQWYHQHQPSTPVTYPMPVPQQHQHQQQQHHAHKIGDVASTSVAPLSMQQPASNEGRSDSRMSSCQQQVASPCQQAPMLSSAAPPSPGAAVAPSPAAVHKQLEHSPAAQPSPVAPNRVNAAGNFHNAQHRNSAVPSSSDYFNAATTSSYAGTSNAAVASTSQQGQMIEPSFEDIANWTKDFDLSDLSLAADLFGNASTSTEPEKLTSGMHSVLEYDPSTLTGLYQNEGPPGSEHASGSTIRTPQKSSTQVPFATPKLREKVKMRKEKELADADKEFDRLLSLVAKKNAVRNAPIANIILPSVPQIEDHSNQPSTSHASSSYMDVDAGPSTSCGPLERPTISLSPVQFTPPDSPVASNPTVCASQPYSQLDEPCDSIVSPGSHFSHPPSTPAPPATPAPSTSTNDVLLFIPKVDSRGSSEKKRVPVYKQHAASVSGNTSFRETVAKREIVNEVVKASGGNDDEYAFTDDEDDEPERLASGASVEQLKEQKLEQEVAQKLAHISNLHPELKSSIQKRLGPFVPGVGQMQPEQDLWKHVVPKKRGAAAAAVERPNVPCTPLLPPGSQMPPSVGSVESLELEPPKPVPLTLAQQLAETLKRLREQRTANCVVKTQLCLDDNTTAKPSPVRDRRAEADNIFIKLELSDSEHVMEEHKPRVEQQQQPVVELLETGATAVPKVIIRLPKRSPSTERSERKKHKKKKKHKHHKREEDEDGEKKRKKKHRRRHSKDGSEEREGVVCMVDSDAEDPSWKPGGPKVPAGSPAVFSKKRRLMQWQQTEDVGTQNAAVVTQNGEEQKDVVLHKKLRHKKHRHHHHSKRDRKIEREEASAIDRRLAQFSQPTGSLPRGTFVVNKGDLMNNGCPLWKVDNQNLLQKFLPSPEGGRLVYRNSQTYSGWCDQLSDSYLVIQVRFIKHSRAETIVEPEVPLTDLFPAISCEIGASSQMGIEGGSLLNDSHNELVNGGALSPPECDQHQQQQQQQQYAAPQQALREAMETYMQAMIHHAMSGTFLQTIRHSNDWKFLRHMNDINRLSSDHKAKLLLAVKWVERYKDLVEWYPLCAVNDSECHGLTCQACNNRSVDKVVQLFANCGYDYDTLDPVPLKESDGGSPLPSTEYLVCSACASVTVSYHKLHHMRYTLYKRCEDKVEEVKEEHPRLDAAGVMEQCMKNRQWVANIVQEYASLWKKLDES